MWTHGGAWDCAFWFSTLVLPALLCKEEASTDQARSEQVCRTKGRFPSLFLETLQRAQDQNSSLGHWDRLVGDSNQRIPSWELKLEDMVSPHFLTFGPRVVSGRPPWASGTQFLKIGQESGSRGDTMVANRNHLQSLHSVLVVLPLGVRIRVCPIPNTPCILQGKRGTATLPFPP